MQPYGRDRKLKFKNKIDHHIHEKGRKIKNWWEAILPLTSRSMMKQKFKKEVREYYESN